MQENPGQTFASNAVSSAPNPPTGFRFRTLLAWGVTLLAVGVTVVSVLFATHEDKIGPQMASATGEIQGKYFLGLASFSPTSNDQTLASVSTTSGTVNQRLGNIVLVADLKDAESAREALGSLKEVIDEEVIEAERLGRDCYASDADQKAFDTLQKLYAEDTTPVEAVVALADEERSELKESLGWYGELALAPKGLEDDSQRQALISASQTVLLVAGGGFLLALVAGFFGLVGFIMLLVNVANGNIVSKFKEGIVRPGLYIETFAIWMVVVIVGQLLGGLIGLALPTEYRLMPMLFVFFGSLLVLAWPSYCGARFADVRRDIGWSLPSPAWATGFYGIGGYLMGLPLVVIGLVFTVALTVAMGSFEQSNELAPTNGPSHPIVLQLMAGNPLVVLQVFLLGSVAAPIVEETMFRGVLYRHLREISRSRRFWISVVFSTFVNTLLFAAIHPQGLATIPALMSLAIAFTLAREILDSTLPSMLMHGISNGITLTIALTLFA